MAECWKITCVLFTREARCDYYPKFLGVDLASIFIWPRANLKDVLDSMGMWFFLLEILKHWRINQNDGTAVFTKCSSVNYAAFNPSGHFQKQHISLDDACAGLHDTVDEV